MSDQVIPALKGEVDYIEFLFQDRDKRPVDVSTGVDFHAVAYNATVRLFTKSEVADFDVTDGAAGYMRMLTNFAAAGKWRLLLTATYDTGVVRKSRYQIDIEDETIPEPTAPES
jgi:hypothetical protein